jgi:hypothetical protein
LPLFIFTALRYAKPVPRAAFGKKNAQNRAKTAIFAVKKQKMSHFSAAFFSK